MNIIFLDIDGVLNSQLFYQRVGHEGEERENNICTERVKWLNELCEEINAKVVISSSWRHSGLQYCKDRLAKAGATFDIIDITPNSKDGIRGVEIYNWIKSNEELIGVNYYDFSTYVIIDDDSDMLLWQQENFFNVDHYSGLTPNTCYKIKRFFTKREQFGA